MTFCRLNQLQSLSNLLTLHVLVRCDPATMLLPGRISGGDTVCTAHLFRRTYLLMWNILDRTPCLSINNWDCVMVRPGGIVRRVEMSRKALFLMCGARAPGQWLCHFRTKILNVSGHLKYPGLKTHKHLQVAHAALAISLFTS